MYTGDHQTVCLVNGGVDISVIYSVGVICHNLMSQQIYCIHRRRYVHRTVSLVSRVVK